MYMAPKLSVIIPVYNAERRLHICIDSIIQQSFADVEIILVNDGSVDRSLEICNQYAERDARVRVYSQPNQGVSAARNNGIKHATGEYLSFIDADDHINPDTYQLALQHIVAAKVDMLAFGMSFDFYKNNELIKNKINCIVDNLFINKSELKDYFFYLYGKNYLTSACNRVVKRSVITANNIWFDTNMASYEDLAFVLDLLDKCQRLGALNLPLYHYYHNVLISEIKKRPDIDYMKNYRILADKLCRATSNLGMQQQSDIRKINGMIYRYYLISLEKFFASNASVVTKYSELKKFAADAGVKSAMLQAQCSGFRLNMVLYLFKQKLIFIIFVMFFMNELYANAKRKVYRLSMG